MHFMPRSSNKKLLCNILIFYGKCSYTFHSANKEKKIINNTYLTPTTAVYVVPCKY